MIRLSLLFAAALLAAGTASALDLSKITGPSARPQPKAAHPPNGVSPPAALSPDDHRQAYAHALKLFKKHGAPGPGKEFTISPSTLESGEKGRLAFLNNVVVIDGAKMPMSALINPRQPHDPPAVVFIVSTKADAVYLFDCTVSPGSYTLSYGTSTVSGEAQNGHFVAAALGGSGGPTAYELNTPGQFSWWGCTITPPAG